MRNVLRIAGKEFGGFFASPTAFLFLGAFLAVTLFIFFWVETFFARNIADARPLFEWMPMLLIFLVSAITMRMWSEERSSGTLALLLTSPVPALVLVLGKFLACVGLVAVALVLTLPIPLSVAQLGSLDWGPVFGGYLATIFLAGTYVAIGLCVSARSSNAIVSLIATALVCSAFYLIGSDRLTALFGGTAAEILKLLGSGSRVASITRGVLDLRDLYYYASLVGIFLTLNVLALEWMRWAGNPSNSDHRRYALITGLWVANFVAGNLWLAPVGSARADLTQGDIYSISEASREYLRQLREPLLIRGYFSAQTYPLLAPLVPRLRDLLTEYAQAGGGRVSVEFIDPKEEPELEQEATEKFGIRPVAFQTSDKYQASVVNSYFDIVIQYGDEFETLGFRDLIDVKAQSDTDLEVDLRNPEYDITRAVKKVLYAYQASGDLFENIRGPLAFKGYSSPAEKLPPSLAKLRGELEGMVRDLAAESGGKLTVEFIDPAASDGALAEQLRRDFGFRPMMAGLLRAAPFWFHMTLQTSDQVVQLALPADGNRAELERNLKSALRRFSAGMMRTVAVDTPAPVQAHGMKMSGFGFQALRSALEQEHGVIPADLKSGRVAAQADLLMLVAPRDLGERELFAVDQFLMRGGTVILATSPFEVDPRRELAAREQRSGLEDWLAHHGVDVAKKLVLDPRSAPFPVPVQRRVGAMVVQETRMLDYPFFVDVRGEGLETESGLAGGMQQVTLHWPSPIAIDAEKNRERRVVRLLESSGESWASEGTQLIPTAGADADFGLRGDAPRQSQLLAAVVEGRFTSYFEGKPSPLGGEVGRSEKDESEKDKEKQEAKRAEDALLSRVIDRSPESARLIVFASNGFLTDEMLSLSSRAMGTEYRNPVQLVENAVDWALEDRGLLGIRGRAKFSRTLEPLTRDRQMLWEYGNYGAAAAGLLVLWLLRAHTHRARRLRYDAALRAARV
jgi:ABC-2 type transport system permease protein